MQYDITVDDILAFQKDYLSSNRQFKRQIARIRLLGFAWGVLFVITAAGMLLQGLSLASPRFILMATVGTAILLLCLFSDKYTTGKVMKNASRLYALPENAGHLGDKEMMLGDEGITVSDKRSECKFCWDYIIRVNETPEHFIVYVTGLTAHVIPKRGLIGEDAAALKELFNKHVTPKK